MVNVNAPATDQVSEEPGYRFGRLRLGKHLDLKKLSATVYEVPPGERTWPYHWHHANEELAIVVSGELVLREPEGERTLVQGDAVVFRVGREGAHQFRNDSAETARVLIVATNIWPDMTQYPDSGKIGLFGIEGFAEEGGWQEMWLPVGAEVDYYEGEKLVEAVKET